MIKVEPTKNFFIEIIIDDVIFKVSNLAGLEKFCGLDHNPGEAVEIAFAVVGHSAPKVTLLKFYNFSSTQLIQQLKRPEQEL